MGDLSAPLSASDLSTRARIDGAFAALYDELAIIARARLRRSAGEITSTGALVHECWLRLQRAGRVQFGHEGQFLALAASVMRSVIVDTARRAAAQRRGGDAAHITLDTGVIDAAAAPGGGGPLDVLALEEALGQLADHDARLARVVEMRFFAGCTEAQMAQALGCSERTVRRDWERARAFLALAMRDG